MSMTEIDPSSKIQLRNIGELMHPGCCAVCGNGTCQDGYLDLGIYFDYEGQVYICVVCATQAGETIGMLSRDESVHVEDTNVRLADMVSTLETELAEANERLNSYDRVFNDISNRAGVTGLSSISTTKSTEGSTIGTDDNIDSDASGKVSGNSKPAKSTSSNKHNGPTRPKRSDVEL